MQRHHEFGRQNTKNYGIDNKDHSLVFGSLSFLLSNGNDNETASRGGREH